MSRWCEAAGEDTNCGQCTTSAVQGFIAMVNRQNLTGKQTDTKSKAHKRKKLLKVKFSKV